MHRKKILTALALFIISLPATTLGAKPANLRLLAEKEFTLLKKNLQAEKNLETRFKLLAAFETKIKKLRDSGKRQDEDDEIYLDQLEGGLKLIPRTTGFSNNGCEAQKAEILFTFEPTAEKKAKQPAVAQTLEALELVGRCTQNSKK